MRVCVLGATGFVGRALVSRLLRRDDDVLVLTRRPKIASRVLGEQVKTVKWSPEYDPAWGEAIEGYDAVINLAGAPIFGRRWTEKQKDLILESRTESTAGIIKAIRRADHWPDTLINASAVGYYGPHEDEILDEDSPPGEGFLAEVCREWEEEVEDDDTESVRTVRVRFGLILGKRGGALREMIKPFKMSVGGPLGSGRQWMSWIHLEDLLKMLLWALDDPRVEGPLNGTAPNPVTNREFAQILGRVLNRPSWITTPAFALRLAYGEAADLMLEGQRVIPKRVLEMGFDFRFPTLEDALRDILKSG